MLDQLQDLGIRGSWLMPVTENADGDHRDATTDIRDLGANTIDMTPVFLAGSKHK